MLVLENDQIKKRENVQIDLEDRGYQFGDGIYEVIRVYNGRPFFIEGHMQRLERSARELKLKLPLTIQQLQEKIAELIAHARLKTGNVYLQVTRGAAPRNHPFPHSPRPVLTGYVIPGDRPYDMLTNGISAITAEDIRWLRCDIKSLNLLGSVLAKQKAAEHGCDEAILHRNETVTEGSSTNFFIVKDNTLMTHPANNLILHGITRATAIHLAEKLNIKVDETPFQRKHIFDADEAFITGTTLEACPVTHVDDRPIGDGRPGDVTKRLQQAFDELIANN